MTNEIIPMRYRHLVGRIETAVERLKSRRITLIPQSWLGEVTRRIPIRIRGVWHTDDGCFIAVIH